MALYQPMGKVLHKCAERFSDRPFLTLAPQGETYTYAAFETLTNRIAHGLRDTVSDLPTHIALLLENSAEYLAATYALKKLDIVEVSVNRAFRGPALVRAIGLTKTPILITSQAHFDALGAILGQLPDLRRIVVTDGFQEARRRFTDQSVIAFEDILSEKTHHIQSSADDLAPAAVMFTSGTTGLSKGCVLSHRYGVRTAENVVKAFRVTGEDTIYSPYPLSHIGPAYYDVLPSMLTGGQVVLRDGFSLSQFWTEINRFGVTWFLMLGSVQQLLWSAEPSQAETGHKVTRCWSTPAPVPKDKWEARFDMRLIPGGGYGSTDAGWVVCPQWDHPGGIVFPEFEIGVAGEDGAHLPKGSVGELVVRPKEAGVMSDAYFGMPEKTAETRKNGWFYTGDIARIDEDGLFYFVCRKAERIRVKGEMVSGAEVEEGIVLHPDVEDCAVIGVPSALGEEEVKAFVTLKPGRCLTTEALQAHCRPVMAKYMVPTQVVFLDEIPRTPTGKPEKGALAAYD
ncbi:MAG: AMP-binding protein [Pseudomonadota bacterium]